MFLTEVVWWNFGGLHTRKLCQFPLMTLSSYQHRNLVCLFWSGAYSPVHHTTARKGHFEHLDVPVDRCTQLPLLLIRQLAIQSDHTVNELRADTTGLLYIQSTINSNFMLRYKIWRSCPTIHCSLRGQSAPSVQAGVPLTKGNFSNPFAQTVYRTWYL